MFMMMMMLMMTMMMLLKCAIQFHGTMELLSRANSTAAWNQIHDVCGVGSRNQFHSTLKPIPRSRGIQLYTKTAIPRCRRIISTTNWTNSTDPLKKLHGAMELVSQITQTRDINCTAPWNFTHNIYLWSTLINPDKIYLNEERIIIIRTWVNKHFLNGNKCRQEMDET